MKERKRGFLYTVCLCEIPPFMEMYLIYCITVYHRAAVHPKKGELIIH